MPNVNIALVAVEKAAYHFDTEYSYRIPAGLLSSARVGCRVLVPFGTASKKRQGLILAVMNQPDDGRTLKPLSDVTDAEPVLNDEGIRLVRFLKERTFCTFFEAAKAVLPTGLGRRMQITYALAKQPDGLSLSEDARRAVDYLQGRSGYVREEKICADTGVSPLVLSELYASQIVTRNVDSVRRMSDLTVKSMRLSEAYLLGEVQIGKLTQKQQSVIDLLGEVGSASVREICYYTGLTAAVPASLVKKGAAEFFSAEVYRRPYAADEPTDTTPIALTQEQEAAYTKLSRIYDSGKGGAALLYGVTGSGKTKVYMKLIDRCLDDGRDAILMVPEIALTPQMLQLLFARYGKKVAVFHSALSVGERLDEWKRVKRGEAQIAVGTRSAVFAPFEHLGLVVLDEEQEGAYKSENAPRYHARDVARFRCAEHKALLVLASATPSLETFAAAEKGRYALCTLTHRYANALLPDVVTVDMTKERRRGNTSEISETLLSSLRETLADGRQAILLMNRRGYHTFASCTACGHVVTCPSCSISMTYHRANERLMCHYCGHSIPFTPVCPACGERAVQYTGFGTQKVEDELSHLLPEARVLRMDTDTTMSRFAHEDKLRLFADRQYDILLGTQMVAKGLDFENVTLVGVISVDSLLYNDDFRALERTFSLLTQVVGRSGRGQYKGTAIIQTAAPENDVLQMAARQDYEEFYRTEIGIRRTLVYPPFCDLCVVAFFGEEELYVRGASKVFLEQLTALSRSDDYAAEKLIVLGPAPARVLRVSDRFRYRLIIKCKNSARFRSMIAELLCRIGKDKRFRQVTTVVDINPESIL
ncbi:MAG: primosomal protein N' [Clostridia bacterium]|nr:primosomal protein N' [Clostridia bacterium]